MARIRAVIRRLEAIARRRGVPPAAGPAKGRIALGRFQLDVGERRLLDANGADVAISAAEFDLLSLFVRHPNVPLNRDHIMDQAHRRGWEVFDRSIDLRIMRLPRKIEVAPERPRIIKTVRNVGYVFVPSSTV